MQVYCLTDLDELRPYADDWDRLAAAVPLRSWAWLSTWWRHYGQQGPAWPARRDLFVLCVFDHTDRLVGVAPWYLDHHEPQGRVIRWLGSGEVCSDYQSVLCQPGREYLVTQAVADFLMGDEQADDRQPPPWDLLEIAGVDAADLAVGHLVRHLERRGNCLYRGRGPNCWRIALPATWDGYLAMLSRGHRKQVRRLERRFLATGRAALHTVQCTDELPRAIELLVELHQRRRRKQGLRGCFASPRFAAFHREVMPQLLANGQLLVHWLELDGRPAAAEYHLSGGGVIYAYQAGINPDLLDEEPGRLITLATLLRAIEQGYRAFDLLRGDEPYKAHFRAIARPALAVSVVPNRAAAHLRHNLWLAGGSIRQWIKRSVHWSGSSGQGPGREIQHKAEIARMPWTLTSEP